MIQTEDFKFPPTCETMEAAEKKRQAVLTEWAKSGWTERKPPEFRPAGDHINGTVFLQRER